MDAVHSTPAVPGIYAIVNTVSGKRYVGSSVNLRIRRGQHRRDLEADRHGNQPLQRAYKKYGPKVLVFTILEVVHDLKELLIAEQRWISQYPPQDLYNASLVAGSSLGIRRSPETIERMKLAAQARMTDEAKARIAAALKGRKLTPKQVERHHAVMRSEKYRALAAANQTGKRQSEATKIKKALATKASMSRPEHRAAALKAITGRHVSGETRSKISQANKGKLRTPEQKARMAAIQQEIRARKRKEKEEWLRILNATPYGHTK